MSDDGRYIQQRSDGSLWEVGSKPGSRVDSDGNQLFETTYTPFNGKVTVGDGQGQGDSQVQGQDDSDGVHPDDQQMSAPTPPTPGPTVYAQTPEGHWIMQDPNGSRYHVYDDNGYLNGYAYDGDMPPGATEAEPPELFPEPAPQPPLRDMSAELLDHFKAQRAALVRSKVIAALPNHPDDAIMKAFKAMYFPELGIQGGAGTQIPANGGTQPTTAESSGNGLADNMNGALDTAKDFAGKAIDGVSNVAGKAVKAVGDFLVSPVEAVEPRAAARNAASDGENSGEAPVYGRAAVPAAPGAELSQNATRFQTPKDLWALASAIPPLRIRKKCLEIQLHIKILVYGAVMIRMTLLMQAIAPRLWPQYTAKTVLD